MATLDNIQAALDQVRAGTLAVHAFSASTRAETQLLAQLPPRFTEVLNDLLDRLESSALFSEESCSFSQSGLLDNLQLWIAKAQERLR
ncbi:hypothetical protein [uncultured Ramlibacter sp.]|uniref:hypothetical protein n=1 Tax=uncultured Ramlibacter sp. TaxID=260755 RepID=UPI002625648D|nr:hypothetical protein [uncultured Ramlibacter sp.]